LNIVFTFANTTLLWHIRKALRPQENAAHRLAILWELTLLPVSFFFAFLYYTDAGSTFFVLLMYLLDLRGNRLSAALVCVHFASDRRITLLILSEFCVRSRWRDACLARLPWSLSCFVRPMWSGSGL